MNIEYLIKAIRELCLVALGKVRLYVDRFGWTPESRAIEQDVTRIIDICEGLEGKLK